MKAASTFARDRDELLGLLRTRGILYESKTQPVLSRDGQSAKWMLDSLSVSLTPRGAELAGRCLLELLERFQGTQLATFGVTGIPLLQSCVLQSKGRYRGLLVRKERKPHGSRKLIEGAIDPSEPVVILDDSVSSGLSMGQCVERLQEAGLFVEGGLCLVRFGWLGGFSAMQEAGYRMEALYDIWDDFMSAMPDEEMPPKNPTRVMPEVVWASRRAPEGLHPAKLAREVMAEYLRTGKVLRPPSKLDRAHDGRGGIWVSVRPRADVYERHARNGFWHFPGEARASLPHELTLAAHLTAQELAEKVKSPAAALEQSALAVTFFSPLEECTVGELDDERYGIVARSRERLAWMGGALPRMPGITNGWQQLHHARVNNARLEPHEPYLIYRHEVSKVVDEGEAWQPTGVSRAGPSWSDDPRLCGRVASRAREHVLARLRGDEPPGGEPLPESLLPMGVEAIYLTVYSGGRLCGCMGGPVADLDGTLRHLAAASLQDGRFGGAPSAADLDGIAVTVSFLFDRLEMGEAHPAEVIPAVRHAEQALMASRGKRSGLLLPFVAVTANLDGLEYATAVVGKAGLGRRRCNWTRYDCSTWLCAGPEPLQLKHGLPPGTPPASLGEAIARLQPLLTSYLLRHLRKEGEPYLHYEPFADLVSPGLDGPRLAHYAWVLARANRAQAAPVLRQAVNLVVRKLLPSLRPGAGGLWLSRKDEPASISELAFLLLAHCDGAPVGRARAKKLADTLWERIDLHGRIAPFQDPLHDHDAYQDYYPCQALLALGRACEAKLCRVNRVRLERALRYYGHRFRTRRDWGLVSWLPQACGVWYRVTGEPRFATLADEVVSWALTHQQAKSGAFLNDHQPDTPGYTTALYLEGVAAAAAIAAERGDAGARRRYLAACGRGLRFVDRLVYQERDLPLLPNPGWALGGVRCSLVRSEVRIDFVQHALSALLSIAEASRQGRPKTALSPLAGT
ncbi:MAG: AMMECR1 domain-containing protein [Myxococcaceae bacterium]